MSEKTTDLTFDIWQFVRLMVHLEDAVKTSEGADLLAAWKDIWEPLDRDLARLHEEDFAAYSDMMMGQSITIETVTAKQAHTVADTIKGVLGELDGLIDDAKDKETQDALAFERSELADLRKQILKRARA